jgi:uncharacterized protein (TIGR02271 family)
MAQDKTTRTQDKENRDANRDPITGAPGSHPVGTGIGAAAGGAAGAAGGVAAGVAAGAAAGTAGGGPIGGAIGAAAGAIIGGLAGKGIAEKVNPTEEDAYWREHYNRETYYDPNYNYDDYSGAYRTGYEGFARYGGAGKGYDEIETDLQREYERNYGSSRLRWDKARPAVRAAWQRFDRHLDQYIGYDVVDRNGNSIGTLECLWADHRGEPAFVGIRTGWFLGKTHVVPANSVEVSERGHRLRLPYTTDKVKNAPAYDGESEMTEEKEREIYRYYGLQSGTGTSSTATGAMSGTAAGTAETRAGYADAPPVLESHRQGESREGATLQLSEEQLRVGKREVEAGGVRLRKIVRTEMVNQPVELRREEIVIERVPAGEGQAEASFGEQEIYIPLRREEAVVEKEARVREEVRARKESQTDTEQVTERVRREDIEVEHTGEAREEGRHGGRGGHR